MLADYAHYEFFLTSTQLVLVMLGMGATLSLRDFRTVATQPRSLIVGLLCQFVMTPLVAYFCAKLFRVPEPIAVGMMLVAVMPGGSYSNLITYLGRGNVALSVALTALATLCALITVPLSLLWIAGKVTHENMVTFAGHIIGSITLFSLLPLGIGMIVGRQMSEASRNLFAKRCVQAGVVILFVIVFGSLGSGRIHPAEYGWGPPLVVILFCVMTQQLAMVPFRIWSWPSPDRFAVGVEVTVRNINLALMLKATIFPAEKGSDPIGDGALFVILFYGAASLIAAIPPIFIHRRALRKAEKRLRREQERAHAQEPLATCSAAAGE